MIDDLKKLEQRLKDVETECQEADWQWGFEEALKEYHGADEVISFAEAKKLADSEKMGGFCAKSKIPSLDFYIDGFRDGNLIVITAPTGEGKTTFCQTLTKNFSDDGVKSLWFSYEVPARQFLQKYGENIPACGYMPKSLITNQLVWIERKIVEAMVKYGTKVVFIDHLHFLFNMTGKYNPSLEIGALVRQIKLIAIKYNIIIFLIAHLTKTKFDEKIGLEDIRDSSFISQEADYVMILWRDMEHQSARQVRENGIIYNDQALLSVCKNRFNGKLGSIKLKLNQGLFEELSKNYDTEIGE